MLLSVVMPVYNAEKYLREAIESVLNQTFREFEFIIIDDGSRDSSLAIINSYNDNRIKIIVNNENKGLVYSLNHAISIARGYYIARMDADDICDLDRFQKQFDFLERKANIDIIGTNINLLTESGVSKVIRIVPEDMMRIRAFSIYHSPLMHPAVMGKREVFIENLYEEKMKGVEDYYLWSKLLLKYRIYNLKEPLLTYRVLESSVSRVAIKEDEHRYYKYIECMRENLRSMGIKLSEEELKKIGSLYSIVVMKQYLKREDMKEIAGILKSILRKNQSLNYCSQRELKKVFSLRYAIGVIIKRDIRNSYRMLTLLGFFHLFGEVFRVVVLKRNQYL